MKIYLAHAFAEKEEGKRIQTEIEKLGIEVINPFERGEQVIYDRKFNKGQRLSARDCSDIVNMDLTKINQSDAVVALLLNPEKTLGTYMEIIYAGERSKPKPVLCYTNFPRLAEHPWVRYYCRIYQKENGLYNGLRYLKGRI